MKTFSSNPAFGSIKDQIDGIWKNSLINLQNVHTPEELCYDILSKLKGYCEDFSEKTFATFNIEFVEMLITDFGVKAENIWFFTDCFEKFAFLHLPRYKGVHAMKEDFATLIGRRNEPMKFDCVIGNPPYQTKSDAANTKTQAIWDKFVNKSFEICKEGGYVSLIHPSGWRNVDGMFKETQNLLVSKDVKYLEIHDENDGLETFGAETRYDWYISSNCENSGKTEIVGKNGETCQIDLENHEFIPNGLFQDIQSLLAKNDEPRVEVINNSAYHHQRPHMSKDKDDVFMFPCIYMVNSKDECKLYYSNHKNKGHFGSPKLIWSHGRITSIGSFVDSEGEYGLTEFGSAIVDKKENLTLIKKAFDSDRFRAIMQQCAVGQLSVNHKIIRLFRKDFWKEFVNEDRTEKV